VAGEQDQAGRSVADQVDERLVGGDGQLGFERSRHGESEAGGCSRDGPLFVDADVGGVHGRIEGRVRADGGV
jgi:hypothetical protein